MTALGPTDNESQVNENNVQPKKIFGKSRDKRPPGKLLVFLNMSTFRCTDNKGLASPIVANLVT
ncbi:hypothetical protein BC937DRAFT_89858 [Endogone sp. FLAS-F59071]|nr:hypothetical protein BC937DRAFT_89858 [Endogone sp. FLAS-F59071]|eukprot:RUS17527.1 hypothetical protein BC937DRAFT_89858 [Endogone sp. FLAS-F59071]